MGHEPLGAERSYPRGVVSDWGGRNRGPAIPHCARNLRAVLRPRGGIRGQRFACACGRTAQPGSPAFTGGAIVSLDYGSLDVYPALHGIPTKGWCAVQLGDVSLDDRESADGIRM